MFKICIILVLLIILINVFSIKKEPFNNYKSQLISPQPNIYKTLQLNIISNNKLCESLANNLQLIYPIKTISSNLTSIQNIQSTNKNYNVISFIQEPAYYHFISKYPDNNINFISSIAIEKWTLVTSIYNKTTKWRDFKNKTIGTLSKSSGSYIILHQINKYFNLNITIKTFNKLDTTIIKSFRSKKIDGFFIITSHPNDMISSINKFYPLQFISIDDLDKKLLSTVFPYFKETKIDLYEYNIFNNNPTTLSSKIDIICHKDLPYIDGYNLIKTLFRNLVNFKIKNIVSMKKSKNSETELQYSNIAEENKKHRLRMKEFNPDNLYLTHSEYTLQTGVYNFYKEIGLITNNPSRSCVYTVGIDKCTDTKINHFRLL